jgi:hypothetical protein
MCFDTHKERARRTRTCQTRALDLLKDNTGFHLLMGSAADAVSFEANSYGEGLLTYALLEGMKGAALKNVVDVDVATLFDHAAERVPDLAYGIGGIQKPLPFAPSGAESFPIGEIQSADRSRIPLAVPNEDGFAVADTLDRCASGDGCSFVWSAFKH